MLKRDVIGDVNSTVRSAIYMIDIHLYDEEE
jgi:hypothetical protein